MDKILEKANEQFRADRGLEELNQSELFESFSAFCILHSIYRDEFEPEDFRVGGSNDLSVDSVAVLINGDLLIDKEDIAAATAEARTLDVHFILIQSKTTPSFDGRFITDFADNLVQIFEDSSSRYPASPDIKNLQESIEHVYEDIGKLRTLPRLSVFYATSGRVTGAEHLDSKREAAENRLDETNFFGSVEFQLLGARELRDLYHRATTAVPAKFTMGKKISIPKIPGVEQAFLGLLSAVDLVSIITDNGGSIRKSIFFENVRDFQDYNAVNTDIQGTVRDSSRRQRFAVLNNGVTIVSRELRTAGDEMWLFDFQVVNGCQTCHVLFDEQDNLAESVWVPVKIIESRDDDIIAGITAATNRQTAVTDEDLEAKERFHKDLEDLFNSYEESRRLYYERRSEQYSSQPNIEKTRVINRGQLRRAFASVFLGEPARAARSYKTLRESRKDDIFQERHDPLVYYTSASALYRVEWLIRNRKIDRKYSPAKYHILHSIKKLIISNKDLPQSPRKQKIECEKILEVVWDGNRSTELVKHIIRAIDIAIENYRNNELERDFLRSQALTAALDQTLGYAPDE